MWFVKIPNLKLTTRLLNVFNCGHLARVGSGVEEEEGRGWDWILRILRGLIDQCSQLQPGTSQGAEGDPLTRGAFVKGDWKNGGRD